MNLIGLITIMFVSLNAFAQSNSDELLKDPNVIERINPANGKTEIVDRNTGEVIYDDKEAVDAPGVEIRRNGASGEYEAVDRDGHRVGRKDDSGPTRSDEHEGDEGNSSGSRSINIGYVRFLEAREKFNSASPTTPLKDGVYKCTIALRDSRIGTHQIQIYSVGKQKGLAVRGNPNSWISNVAGEHAVADHKEGTYLRQKNQSVIVEFTLVRRTNIIGYMICN